MNGQSNMWGQIEGTGLAGEGTGAAGRHGDTSAGAAAHEHAFHVVPKVYKQEETAIKPNSRDQPESYYKRDLASASFVVAHKEATARLELPKKAGFDGMQAEGFAPVRGLQVNVKTSEEDDKVLLVANLPTSTKDNHEGAAWTFKRGSAAIGPRFATWTHEIGRLENVLMPWVDEPGRARLDCDYTVQYRTKAMMEMSIAGEKRHLTAIAIPGHQVTMSSSQEPLSVQPGRWYDVPGLSQIAATNVGEKVLVVCSINYTALWSDEETRGRFTIFRDGKSLDPESYGLQSVRALQKGMKRSLVMALVDDPQEGPHIYEVRAAVTTVQGETRVCHIEDQRQLALIRLPGHIVSGPSRCEGQCTVSDDSWTEVPGLSVSITVEKPHSRVMIVWSCNFNPSEFTYEAYFTLFRLSHGSMENLGGESQGMWSVASSAAGSSEYPVCMFTDSPGAGQHSYVVHARSRRCGQLLQPTPVDVGPDGQISALLIESQVKGNVVELLTKEMEASRANLQSKFES